MNMIFINSEQINKVITMKEIIELNGKAYEEYSKRKNKDEENPQRVGVASKDGRILIMPAYNSNIKDFCIKLVSVFKNNKKYNTPMVNALVILADNLTGKFKAIIDGTKITSIRTGGASGFATDILARKNAHNFALIGAGAQAYDQVRGVMAVRNIKKITVFSRSKDKIIKLLKMLKGDYPNLEMKIADSSKEAIEDADIITCITNSMNPVLDINDIKIGTHINAMGSFEKNMKEINLNNYKKVKIFVDSKNSTLKESGEIIGAIESKKYCEDEIIEIGDVVINHNLGRKSNLEITLFKSVGLGIQDLFVSNEIYNRIIK